MHVNIKIRRCGMSANETTLHPSHNVVKVSNYRLQYDLQCRALAHTKQ